MAKKILIVDDEVDLVEMVSFRLEAAGYKVRQAYNGKDCLEVLKSFTPDLILLDIMMPEMDGVQTAKYIHAMPKLKAIPIIAFTAMAGDGLQGDLKAMQVVGSVRKPFDPEELVAKVREVI